MFNKHKDEKKVKYNVAAELRRATFTSTIATWDGVFEHEAKVYMKRRTTLLLSKWSQSYSQIYIGRSKLECKCASFALSTYVSENPELIGELQE